MPILPAYRLPAVKPTSPRVSRFAVTASCLRSGLPIPGCAVCITTLDRFNNDGLLNAGSTFGRATVSTENGMVVAKVSNALRPLFSRGT